MAEIIRLRPPEEDREIRRKIGKWCGHKKLGYRLEDRAICCLECDAELDPFDAFISIVRDWSGWTEWALRRKKEAEAAGAELADLKRQIANAKARLGRASRG